MPLIKCYIFKWHRNMIISLRIFYQIHIICQRYIYILTVNISKSKYAKKIQNPRIIDVVPGLSGNRIVMTFVSFVNECFNVIHKLFINNHK